MGEKRFDTIADLVHDGLISFYIEKHASSYIADMAEENNYAELVFEIFLFTNLRNKILDGLS